MHAESASNGLADKAGRASRCRAARVLHEALERRELLSSVTLITHGLELTSDRPPMLDAMKDALVKAMGADTTVMDLRINANSGTPYVESFTQLAGPPPASAQTDHADTVIMLDWAAVSGDGYLRTPYVDTALIAALVAPYLESAAVSGLAHPLAESPIHLIGHSRGGSLVSALAGDLGAAGIWVDQVTTLDPHPWLSDPQPVAYSNVVFADNYYQTVGSLLDLYTTGQAVSGAHNVNLTSVLTEHNLVPTYYDGTIDTSMISAGDGTLVDNGWYSTAATGPRNQTGFYYSEVAGGVRPADGVGTDFGGSGSRVAVSPSGAQWPNIGQITVQGPALNISEGSSLPLTYSAQSGSGTTTVSWFLDPDLNPYNGNEIPVGSSQPMAPASAILNSLNFSASTVGVPAGTYHVLGEISDGTHVRYDVAQNVVTIASAQQTKTFISHLYQDVLGRTAAQADIDYWTGVIASGAQTRQELAGSFLDSTEYRTDLIQSLYQDVLGRGADPGGLSSWLSFFAGGGTLEQMKAYFYGSDEYFNSHGSTLSGLVDAYYMAFLKRHADAGGLSYWTALLADGAGRYQIAVQIESSSQEGAEDIVNGAYQHYLHRGPDGGGLDYWVKQVQGGQSELDLALSFLTSDEYFARA